MIKDIFQRIFNFIAIIVKTYGVTGNTGVYKSVIELLLTELINPSFGVCSIGVSYGENCLGRDVFQRNICKHLMPSFENNDLKLILISFLIMNGSIADFSVFVPWHITCYCELLYYLLWDKFCFVVWIKVFD